LLKSAEHYDLVGCLLQQLIYLTVNLPLSHFRGKVPSVHLWGIHRGVLEESITAYKIWWSS
ncbi:hypothetical protein ABKV19_013637, partial [Rosa sericea]